MAEQNVGGELTKWEQMAIERAVVEGPFYASSGTSAIFDAAWELARRGLLQETYVNGPVYLRATMMGLNAYARSTGRANPSVREVLNIYCDEAEIPRKDFDIISVKHLCSKLAILRGELPSTALEFRSKVVVGMTDEERVARTHRKKKVIAGLKKKVTKR